MKALSSLVIFIILFGIIFDSDSSAYVIESKCALSYVAYSSDPNGYLPLMPSQEFLEGEMLQIKEKYDEELSEKPWNESEITSKYEKIFREKWANSIMEKYDIHPKFLETISELYGNSDREEILIGLYTMIPEEYQEDMDCGKKMYEQFGKKIFDNNEAVFGLDTAIKIEAITRVLLEIDTDKFPIELYCPATTRMCNNLCNYGSPSQQLSCRGECNRNSEEVCIEEHQTYVQQLLSEMDIAKLEWDSNAGSKQNNSEIICGLGTVLVNGQCVPAEKEPEKRGCLIATATYGSELAPKVQFLREIRDNTVLSTASGTSFMTAFNAFYYSFSPAVADLERQNPMFKETVKVAITPLLSSLSLLHYVDIDSEAEMLVYGIGIILLHVGMYFGAPAAILLKIKDHQRKKLII